MTTAAQPDILPSISPSPSAAVSPTPLPPTSPPPTPLPPPVQLPTVVAPPLTEGSPLRRLDSPPDGVAPQLILFQGGLPIEESVAPEPRIRFGRVFPEDGPEAGRFEIGAPRGIYPENFDLSQPVQLTIIWPDGRREGGVVAANMLSVSYLPLATNPPGDYIVIAEQGDVSAQSQFSVEYPSSPRLYACPATGCERWAEAGAPTEPAGTTFQFFLAGYPPSSNIPLHLYGLVENCVCYLATLPPVRTDVNGIGFYALATSPDDIGGLYLLESDPPARWQGFTSDTENLYQGDGMFNIRD